MPARTLHQLQMDGESRATIRSALDELDNLRPQTPNRVREVAELREELTEELRTIEERLL